VAAAERATTGPEAETGTRTEFEHAKEGNGPQDGKLDSELPQTPAKTCETTGLLIKSLDRCLSSTKTCHGPFQDTQNSVFSKYSIAAS